MDSTNAKGLSSPAVLSVKNRTHCFVVIHIGHLGSIGLVKRVCHTLIPVNVIYRVCLVVVPERTQALLISTPSSCILRSANLFTDLGEYIQYIRGHLWREGNDWTVHTEHMAHLVYFICFLIQTFQAANYFTHIYPDTHLWVALTETLMRKHVSWDQPLWYAFMSSWVPHHWSLSTNLYDIFTLCKLRHQKLQSLNFLLTKIVTKRGNNKEEFDVWKPMFSATQQRWQAK